MEPRLVGRSAELRELLGLLDAALDGRPGLALLTGEPGIGKTRLAAELGRMAGVRAVPVLWGGCTDADGAPGYWPWRSVLRAWLARVGREAAAAELHGPAAQVARIAPELPVAETPVAGGDVQESHPHVRSGQEGGLPDVTPEQRFALFDAVSGLLAAIAGPAGLVVVLDDVQWADPASAALLTHVAREARDARLLLLVTGRSAELAGGPLVGDLGRTPGATVLELGGLAEADVAAALADRLGAPVEPDVVAAVAGRTAGNPFFVGEVARSLRTDPEGARVPAAVRDTVRRRLDRLPQSCRALLRPAAVLGRDIDVSLLATVSGAAPVAVLGGLRPAVEDGLLDAGRDSRPRFAHDLVRETVLADLDPAERARVHAAAATALAPAAADPDVVGELARHALAALPLGDAEQAREWARRAGRVAIDRLAFEDAARLLRRAVDVGRGRADAGERARDLLEVARAQARAHDVGGATTTCGEVAALARATGDAATLGRAALVQEGVTDVPWLVIARDWCVEALHGIGEADSPLRARLLAHLSSTRTVLAEPGPDPSADALAMAERLDDPAALVAALRARQLARGGPDGNAERLRLGTRMLEVAERTGAADTAMWGHLWRFDALLQAGRTTDAEAEMLPLEAAVARSGEPLGRLHLLRARIAICFTRGRYVEAGALNAETLAIADRGRHEGARMTGRAAACHLATFLGRDDVRTDDVEFLLAMRTPYAQLIKLSIALWNVALGRLDDAARWCAELLPADSPRIPAFMLLITAAIRAQVAAAFGDADTAATVYRVLAPYRGLHVVGGAGAMASHGPVQLYLGMTAATCGRTAAAIEHLRAAVGESEAAGAVPWVATTRLWLARALRTRGRPGDDAEASAAASAAAAVAAELGMAPLARDLAALDAAPDRLSRREREIAELVGRGLTNRQIAATAHISDRTVESHVQHVLAKLGFARRAEIAAWVARGGQ